MSGLERGGAGKQGDDPFDTVMARPAWVRVLVAVALLVPLWLAVLWAVQVP